MRGATFRRACPNSWYCISTHAPLAGRDYGLSPADFWILNFNPRAPCGARLVLHRKRSSTQRISTHAPLAGRDVGRGVLVQAIVISTHAPLAGRDSRRIPPPRQSTISTHAPLAGRDYCTARLNERARSISTHAPLAGRDQHDDSRLYRVDISTHAPLAGRDTDPGDVVIDPCGDFNPRAPCGARRTRSETRCICILFQPTRPLRGATYTILHADHMTRFQPTRPLRGATSPVARL